MYNCISEKSQISDEKWRSILKDNQFSTPFQSPEFFDFFNSIPLQAAKIFAVEKDNSLKALCVVTIQKEKGLKGYFSRRAIVYGGPVVESDPEALTELLKLILSKLKKEVIYIETRNFNDYSSFQSSFLGQHWNFVPYLNFQVDLQNKTLEELLGQMKYNRKREIRISYEEGAKVDEATSVGEIAALYKILKDLYDTRVKLPLPALDYFEKLYRSSIGKVFVVKHNQNIIGGSFCFYYPNKGIYTLYYCGLRDYHKKIFPTHLSIIAAMEFGIKNNLKILDLMGAGQPGEEYGVRNYKAEFGGLMVEHGRFIKISSPHLYKLGKFGLGILKKVKK